MTNNNLNLPNFTRNVNVEIILFNIGRPKKTPEADSNTE